MRIGAVVLAAGASLRLGQPKQLVEHEGETLLHRAGRFARAVADPVLVVLPADPAPYLGTLKGLDVRALANPESAEGMAASIRVGLAALSQVDGALLMTVDQWALEEAHLRRLVEAFAQNPECAVAAGYEGGHGVPAILPSTQFADALLLRGDRGAKTLLGKAHVVDLPEAAFDLDLPDQLPLRRR